MKKLLLISLAFLLFVPLIKVGAEGEASMKVLSPTEADLVYEIGNTVGIEWEQENMYWMSISVKGEGCSILVINYNNPDLTDSGTYSWTIPEDFYCLGKDIYFSLTGYSESGDQIDIDYASSVFQIVSSEEKVPNIKYDFENVVDRILNSGETNVHLGNIVFQSYYTGYTNLIPITLDNFDITFTMMGRQALSGNVKLINIDTGEELCSVYPYHTFAGAGSSPDISINRANCEANLTILGGETKTFKVVGNIGFPQLQYESGNPWINIILLADKINFSGTEPNEIIRISPNDPIYIFAYEESDVDEEVDIDDPEPIVEEDENENLDKDNSDSENDIDESDDNNSSNVSVPTTQVDQNLTNRLRGRILLQVENHGEAWYVRPDNGLRMYMKDGSSAYNMMRNLGLGISNADLQKIPVGIEKSFECLDSDGDGLCNKLEEGLGTDPNKKDSDGDGFDDGTEITSGYNPLGSSKFSYDNSLVNRLRGQILLQVESRGEAWYINPEDGKRYYMTDGPAAYQIMRFLSLGISNTDLGRIGV